MRCGFLSSAIDNAIYTSMEVPDRPQAAPAANFNGRCCVQMHLQVDLHTEFTAERLEASAFAGGSAYPRQLCVCRAERNCGLCNGPVSQGMAPDAHKATAGASPGAMAPGEVSVDQHRELWGIKFEVKAPYEPRFVPEIPH